MKTFVALLLAIGSLALLGCESKPDPAKPASTNTGATPASSAQQGSTTGGW
jgi:hypothetical protein